MYVVGGCQGQGAGFSLSGSVCFTWQCLLLTARVGFAERVLGMQVFVLEEPAWPPGVLLSP